MNIWEGVESTSTDLRLSDRDAISFWGLACRLAKEEEVKLKREEDERLAKAEEAIRRAAVERERAREAGEQQRMAQHDEDIGERPLHNSVSVDILILSLLLLTTTVRLWYSCFLLLLLVLVKPPLYPPFAGVCNRHYTQGQRRHSTGGGKARERGRSGSGGGGAGKGRPSCEAKACLHADEQSG